MASCFGAKGYNVSTPNEIARALNEILTDGTLPAIVNIVINPSSERKAQVSKSTIVPSFNYRLALL